MQKWNGTKVCWCTGAFGNLWESCSPFQNTEKNKIAQCCESHPTGDAKAGKFCWIHSTDPTLCLQIITCAVFSRISSVNDTKLKQSSQWLIIWNAKLAHFWNCGIEEIVEWCESITCFCETQDHPIIFDLNLLVYFYILVYCSVIEYSDYLLEFWRVKFSG